MVTQHTLQAVIDDHDMQISHVICDDHIANIHQNNLWSMKRYWKHLSLAPHDFDHQLETGKKIV